MQKQGFEDIQCNFKIKNVEQTMNRKKFPQLDKGSMKMFHLRPYIIAKELMFFPLKSEINQYVQFHHVYLIGYFT